MRHKRAMLLISMLTVIQVLAGLDVVYGASYSIKNRSPRSGGKVESMVVPLKVNITSGGEPVPNANVWFYIDGEPVGHAVTNRDGFAGKGVSNLGEFKQYKWYVKVDKHGKTLIKSDPWSFNYQPRPVLTIHSDYGEPYGDGDYTYNSTAVFGIEPTVIDLNESKRVVFVEWLGIHEEGYSGPEVESSVNMTDDITEYAIWKTQYYLNMSCEVPPAVRPESGWYDEENLVGIYVDPLPGTEFIEWVGEGNQSYSGTDMSQTIKILGPIRQEAMFTRDEFTLDVVSEYGNTYGGSGYLAWENVSFGVDSEDVYLSEGERLHFTGWDSDSSNGYEGNNTEYQIYISEDMVQEANWVRQYLVNVSSTEGGNVSTPSGWVDENTELELSTTGEQDYRFVGWTGEGDGSYSGKDKNHTITVKAPTIQEANWKQIFTVTVESEYSVQGEGDYLDGEMATLQAQPSSGLLVRNKFKEWTGVVTSTSNPLTFTVRQDTKLTAVYTRDYMYLLAVVIVIFVLLAVILFKVLA
jgi:hypothetical protein